MRPHGATAHGSVRLGSARSGRRPSLVRFSCRLKIVFYLMSTRPDCNSVRAPSKRDPLRRPPGGSAASDGLLHPVSWPGGATSRRDRVFQTALIERI